MRLENLEERLVLDNAYILELSKVDTYHWGEDQAYPAKADALTSFKVSVLVGNSVIGTPDHDPITFSYNFGGSPNANVFNTNEVNPPYAISASNKNATFSSTFNLSDVNKKNAAGAYLNSIAFGNKDYGIQYYGLPEIDPKIPTYQYQMTKLSSESGTLTIPRGVSNFIVNVVVFADFLKEDPEFATMRISNPTITPDQGGSPTVSLASTNPQTVVLVDFSGLQTSSYSKCPDCGCGCTTIQTMTDYAKGAIGIVGNIISYLSDPNPHPIIRVDNLAIPNVPDGDLPGTSGLTMSQTTYVEATLYFGENVSTTKYYNYNFGNAQNPAEEGNKLSFAIQADLDIANANQTGLQAWNMKIEYHADVNRHGYRLGARSEARHL